MNVSGFPSSVSPLASAQVVDRSANGDAYQLDYLRGKGDEKAKLKHAAEEMESLFVKMMWKAMKATVPKEEMLHGGHAEEVFDDMLSDERSRQWSRTGTFGLADQIFKQMSPQLGLDRPHRTMPG